MFFEHDTASTTSNPCCLICMTRFFESDNTGTTSELMHFLKCLILHETFFFESDTASTTSNLDFSFSCAQLVTSLIFYEMMCYFFCFYYINYISYNFNIFPCLYFNTKYFHRDSNDDLFGSRVNSVSNISNGDSFAVAYNKLLVDHILPTALRWQSDPRHDEFMLIPEVQAVLKYYRPFLIKAFGCYATTDRSNFMTFTVCLNLEISYLEYFRNLIFKKHDMMTLC